MRVAAGILFAPVSLVALTWLSPALAGFTPADEPFVVNTYTSGRQTAPSIARTEPQTFVVVWQSYAGIGVSGQRVDSAGALAGTQFDVGSPDSPPRVAANLAGDFVVAWTAAPFGFGSDDSYGAVVARRFDSTAAPLGTTFLVNTYTSCSQQDAAVAHLDGGDFVVAWTSDSGTLCGIGQDGDDRGVFAQRYDGNGAVVGTEFQVNAHTTGRQDSPIIAALDGGGFAVVWEQVTTSPAASDTSSGGVVGRVFDAGGTPLGGDFAVNTFTTGLQYGPDVARGPGTGFTVVWTSHVNGALDDEIIARRFDSTGAALSGEVTVNASPAGKQSQPAIAIGADGSGLVAWRANGGGGDPGPSIYVRELSSSGVPQGDDLIVTSYHLVIRGEPDVELDDNGNALVAWSHAGIGTALGGDDSGAAIVARRLCSDADAGCEVCTGYDASIDPDADGLPSGCDPCTNVGGAQDIAVKPRLKVIEGTKFERLKLKGEFDLPSAFATLDPEAQGGRVIIESQLGRKVLDNVLVAGSYAGSGSAGWQSNSKGTRWTYRDGRESNPSRIARVVLKDRSNKAPNRVLLSIKDRDGNYGTLPGFLPLRVTFVAGDQAAADAGLCGQTAFAAQDCRQSGIRTLCKQ